MTNFRLRTLATDPGRLIVDAGLDDGDGAEVPAVAVDGEDDVQHRAAAAADRVGARQRDLSGARPVVGGDDHRARGVALGGCALQLERPVVRQLHREGSEGLRRADVEAGMSHAAAHREIAHLHARRVRPGDRLGTDRRGPPVAGAIAELGLGAAIVRSVDMTRVDLQKIYGVSLFFGTCMTTVLVVTAPLLARLFHEPGLAWPIAVASLQIIVGAVALIVIPVRSKGRLGGPFFMLTHHGCDGEKSLERR